MNACPHASPFGQPGPCGSCSDDRFRTEPESVIAAEIRLLSYRRFESLFRSAGNLEPGAVL